MNTLKLRQNYVTNITLQYYVKTSRNKTIQMKLQN